MRTTRLLLFLLMFHGVCFAQEPKVFDFSKENRISSRKNTTTEEKRKAIREADILQNILNESDIELLKPDLAVGKTIVDIYILMNSPCA